MLGYSTQPIGPRRTILDVVFLLLGLPPLVATFVPFCYGVSPVAVLVAAVREFSWREWTPEITILLLGVPFFLPAIAWVLRLRTVAWGASRPVERRSGYAIAGVGLALVLGVLGIAAASYTELMVRERWMFAFAAMALAGGAVAFVAHRRAGGAPDTSLLIALLTPYAANGVICLLAFEDSRQIGWYLTVVSISAVAVELLLRLAFARLGHGSTGSSSTGSPMGGTTGGL